jgi:uncharacterized protein YecT (DUF1311 family)
MDLFRATEKRMLWIAQRFHVPSILGVLLSLASPIAAARQAATATDCSRATTRDEKAICTTPELRAADAAMAKAYSVVKAELPRAQQAALLDDQLHWLMLRDSIEISTTGAPVVESDRDLIGRLLKETDERRGFLAGEGPNQAPDAPRLRPVFFQSREGGYENVVYPRIVMPRSSSERDFNKAARIATGEEGLNGAQEAGRPPGEPVPSSATSGADECYDYDASYEVTYLDRRLAAVVFTVSSYGYKCNHRGGAAIKRGAKAWYSISRAAAR